MGRFELTFPAVITVVRGGAATTRVAAFGGGALLVDLLCGAAAFLDHADTLSLAPAHLSGRVQARIDVDARRLRVAGYTSGIDRAPALRRAYGRALAAAWPGWEVADAAPPEHGEPSVPMVLLRALPEGERVESILTHVDGEGQVRDVGVDAAAEDALSIGPALREAIAARAGVSLGPEVAFVDGVVVPARSGALIDDRARRIEVWWSMPTARERAISGPLARLWPGYTVAAHDEGLPRQLAGSGRDPSRVRVDDGDADALLGHLLRVASWVDPVALQGAALASLDRMRRAGVAVEVPVALRLATRPVGAPVIPEPPIARPLPMDAPSLLHLERALGALDEALARGEEPGLEPLRWMGGPPGWHAIIVDTIERVLAAPEGARALRFLAPRWRLGELVGDVGAADADLVDRVRDALLARARAAPPFRGFVGWVSDHTS